MPLIQLAKTTSFLNRKLEVKVKKNLKEEVYVKEVDNDDDARSAVYLTYKPKANAI